MTKQDRHNAIWGGIFYILVTVASISTIFFLGFLGGGIAGETRPGYLETIAANERQVIYGVFVELIWALGVVGIVVSLHPLLKEYNESQGLGFSALRFLEGVCNVMGIFLLMMLVSVAQAVSSASGTEAIVLQQTGELLLAAREWMFNLGAGMIWALSAVLLNLILFNSRLVPRGLSVWGLIGAVLAVGNYVLIFFGSRLIAWLFAPIAIQEMVFAVWLIVRGVDFSETMAMSSEGSAS